MFNFKNGENVFNKKKRAFFSFNYHIFSELRK